MVSQITVAELAGRLDADDSFLLVDTRQEDSFEQWHIRGAENIPFDPSEGFDDEHRRRVEGAADGEPIVAICGKGLTSTPFGYHLEEQGYDDVTVVRGGMQEWSTLYETVDVAGGSDGASRGTVGEDAAVDDDLVIRQLQRPATGCLGYVVGSRSAGDAVVVDPTRQTEEFVVAAEATGLTVTAVVDTHVHADHLSGGPGLAEELDVPYYLGIDVDDPKVDHPYESLGDGDTLDLGDVELQAMHAPGHTMEMANLLVDGTYLLSADTLFVDSVGRTELGFGDDGAERGAELLYETLHDLLELDDGVTALPGHVSITEDIRFETGSPGEPIGAELGELEAELDLLELDRDAFVERITDDLPEKPADDETVIAVNAGVESIDAESEAAELDTGPNNCSA